MDNNKKNKLLRVMLPGIAVSFALCFMLLVYAPFELYLTNQSSFWYTFSIMAQYTLAMFAAGMLLCVIAFFIAAKLGDRVTTAAVAAAVFVMLGAYIQGTFLVSGLPGMDGTEIDWSAYPAERIKSILAWVLSAAVTAVLLWKLGREKFRKIAGYAGAALGLMLVLSLGMLMFTTRTEKRETLAATDVNLMSFSDGENLVVVHLDAMDAGVFNEVLAQHPEYRDTFADFTYFDNAMTGYGHTKCSVPLILTGQWFIPDESGGGHSTNGDAFDEYLNTELERSPLFTALEEKSYRIGIYDSEDFFLYKDIYDGRIDNMRDDIAVPSDTGRMVKSVFRMAMIKYAPWDLKAAGVYDNSAIVFLSDHGSTLSDEDKREHTLLMIKGRGEKHEFAVNSAPISFEDMSAAFVKLIDGSVSTDAFDWHEGDVRERRFFSYNWLTFTDFVEYIQYGQAGEHETLRPTGRVYG